MRSCSEQGCYLLRGAGLSRVDPFSAHHSVSAASAFAEDMGFKTEDLTTNTSRSLFTRWLQAGCQPNYRQVSTGSVWETTDVSGTCSPLCTKKYNAVMSPCPLFPLFIPQSTRGFNELLGAVHWLFSSPAQCGPC